MYTKHNEDNPKSSIFSFIPQRRRIHPNFMNHTYQTTNLTKDNPNNHRYISVGFTTNTKFVLLQLRQHKFWSIHIQISTNFKKFKFNQFRTFHASPISAFHWSRKPARGLMNNFVHFIHPYMNPLPNSMVEPFFTASVGIVLLTSFKLC